MEGQVDVEGGARRRGAVDVQKGRRPTTIAGYRAKMNRYVLKNEIAEVPLQALAAVDLDKLYSELIAGGGRNRSSLSFRTVRHVHTILGKALSDAERQDLVPRNPARRAMPPSPTAARSPEASTWTPDQLARFLDATKDHHHTALFRLAAMTGMRRGELCGLQWADVDLEGKLLRVRRTITTVAGEIVEGEVKTARSRRTLGLDAVTTVVLKSHRARQLEDRVKMGAGYRDRDFVFAQPSGEPWNADAVGRSFTRAVEKADLPRIRFHDLRHGHATHLLRAGANPRLVSERARDGRVHIGYLRARPARAASGRRGSRRVACRRRGRRAVTSL
jgi:integrase